MSNSECSGGPSAKHIRVEGTRFSFAAGNDDTVTPTGGHAEFRTTAYMILLLLRKTENILVLE